MIDKPAGLIMHPNKRSKTLNVVNLLPHQLSTKLGSTKLACRTRLDKNVSGICFLAKLIYSQKRSTWIPENTQKRSKSGKKLTSSDGEKLLRPFNFQTDLKFTKKSYIARVFGNFDENIKKISLRVGEHENPQHVPFAIVDPLNLEKTSFVTKLKFCENTNTSLVRVEIKSGVFHQIRAHLAFSGFPIVDDWLYNSKKFTYRPDDKKQDLGVESLIKNQARKSEKNRSLEFESICLHAEQYGFYFSENPDVIFNGYSKVPKRITDFEVTETMKTYLNI